LNNKEQLWLHRFKNFLINDPITLLSKLERRGKGKKDLINPDRRKERLILLNQRKNWEKMKCIKAACLSNWEQMTDQTLFSLITATKKIRM